MNSPVLSLVTPVYRGEAFIRSSIEAILEHLESSFPETPDRPRPFELIVVCDGEVDASAAVVEAIQDSRVRLITYATNQGKGFALCAGMAVAEGDLIGWLDSDLDVHPDVIVAAARRLLVDDLDAAVGSKRHPDSVVSYPASRRILSWGFQKLSHLTLRVGVPDTQVGAKLFRREVIATVLPLLRVKRYAFDLEVLAVAAEFGFDRVEQVPVRLEYQFTGSGIDRRAVLRMLQDVLAIVYRVRSRWYVHRYANMHRRRLSETDLRTPAVAQGNLSAVRNAIDIPSPDRSSLP